MHSTGMLSERVLDETCTKKVVLSYRDAQTVERLRPATCVIASAYISRPPRQSKCTLQNTFGGYFTYEQPSGQSEASHKGQWRPSRVQRSARTELLS